MRAQTLTREREQPRGRIGIDALGERWRWATPSRLTWIAFGFLLAGGTAFLLHLTRGTTLWFDDWLWALYRRLRGREGIGLGDVKLAGVAEPGSTGRAFPSPSKSLHWRRLRSAW